MPTPRFAPTGVASDTQLAKEMHQLLSRQDADASQSLDYRFHVTVPKVKSLHKGQVVEAKGTARRGTLADAPQVLDLLQPLSRHTVLVRWDDTGVVQPTPVTTLQPKAFDTEATLSLRLRSLAKPYGTHTIPFRATLDGALVTVESRAHDVLHEIHVMMRVLYGNKAVSAIESPALTDDARKARYYRTRRANPEDVEAQAFQDHTHARLQDARPRLRATVTNRKRYAYGMRTDPWWEQYADENVTITQRRKRLVAARRKATVKRGTKWSTAPVAAVPPAPCNAKQPQDFVHHSVVVPHWSTTDVITSYVHATAVGVEQASDIACRLVRVKHRAHEWTVALPHVHPVDTCQEIRRGSAVFVLDHTASGVSEEAHTKSSTPLLYRLGHIIALHQPNHALVCGFVGQALRTVTAPAICTAASWTAVLEAAFPGERLRVAFNFNAVGQGQGTEDDDARKGTDAGNASARVAITCSSRARFRIAAASTASPMLGFTAGRTYEATQRTTRGVYVLDAPHLIRPAAQVVRTEPQLVVCLDGNRESSVANNTTHTLSLRDVVPVRPQYSHERDAYKHMSPYQRFPVGFLTAQRPQRGMLLYHEMGAGKSRTAIEMAQRYLEDRYWSHFDAEKHRVRPTTRHVLSKSVEPWWGDRPSVVLFSPTQEARTHFLKDEVPRWTACWWTQLHQGADNAASEWVPRQQVYRQVNPSALYDEMRDHEAAVRDFLWNASAPVHANIYLSIVVDNTNSLYRVLNHVQTAVANKSLPDVAKREVLRYFGARPDASLFDIHSRTDADEYYGRFFQDTFVIVDEIHRLCNAMVNHGPGAQGRVGNFFYRALMEARHCRVVGLSGTPMQRTAVAFAPLFNLLHGKTKVWTVGFKAGASKQLQEDTYASIRPLASTIWADHRQSLEAGGGAGATRGGLEARIRFTAWPYPDVTQAVDVLMATFRRRTSLIDVQWQEYELFPFAFQHKGRGKQYAVDAAPFAEQFVKNNRLKSPVNFAKRIVGLVSYVSPPKVTARDDPTLTGAEVYPQYTIHTCRLAMGPSHHAYLQAIHKRKRDINQRQADVEERSGCNVNWGVLHDRTVLDGKEGLLKLFFKGGADGQTLTPQALDAAYHQLLTRVHTLCATQDPRIRPYLRIDEKLAVFAPKLQRILQSLRANYQRKAVVYSEFIDGVGGGGGPTRSSVPASVPDASTTDTSRQTRHTSYQLDTGHVGCSGLGLLGYVLDANGYVRFELRATHVFEEVYALVHAIPKVDARIIVRAIGSDRRGALTAEQVVRGCHTLGLDLAASYSEIVTRLSTDVDWARTHVTPREFGRWLAADAYSPHAKWLVATRTRYSLSDRTRTGLGLVAGRQSRRSKRNHRLSSTARRRKCPPAYIEYGKCLANAPSSVSKTSKADARDFVLRLYNLRSTDELHQLDGSLTTQAQDDVRALLRHTPSGNAYGGLVQTLLASAKVTEAVEFKDVRTMHILEPPQDYRQLEQMFGRVIRRGSHPGVREDDRKVAIRMYVMTMPYTLAGVTADDTQHGAAARRFRTKDEQYWEGVIQRKYEISQDFYTLMKHMAVDCRANLVLNTASSQDKHLTCYDYPYTPLEHGWDDGEASLYGPEDLVADHQNTPPAARAVDVSRAVRRA